jgi:hypothetical protein
MKVRIFTPPYCAQGDLNIFEAEKIPDGLYEQLPLDGHHILAHSETGHHHVVEGNTVKVFQEDEFSAYLDVEKPSNVVHMRGFDTHETIQLPAGKYHITRQREHVPGGFRRAAD